MIKFIMAMIAKANKLVVQTYLVRIIHRVRKDEPGTVALMPVEIRQLTNWSEFKPNPLFRGNWKYCYIYDPFTTKDWKGGHNG